MVISTHIAIPMPPPMHRAATPFLPPVRARAFRRVTRIRQPEAPMGCPRAMAPPHMLTCVCGLKVEWNRVHVSWQHEINTVESSTQYTWGCNPVYMGVAWVWLTAFLGWKVECIVYMQRQWLQVWIDTSSSNCRHY